VKYAHLFWRLFGLPVTGWDDLLYHDIAWMRAAADGLGEAAEGGAAWPIP
jgi:hypothetical protein